MPQRWPHGVPGWLPVQPRCDGSVSRWRMNACVCGRQNKPSRSVGHHRFIPARFQSVGSFIFKIKPSRHCPRAWRAHRPGLAHTPRGTTRLRRFHPCAGKPFPQRDCLPVSAADPDYVKYVLSRFSELTQPTSLTSPFIGGPGTLTGDCRLWSPQRPSLRTECVRPWVDPSSEQSRRRARRALFLKIELTLEFEFALLAGACPGRCHSPTCSRAALWPRECWTARSGLRLAEGLPSLP